MKSKRHAPERIVGKLREADRHKAEGQGLGRIRQRPAVREQTCRRWRNACGRDVPDHASPV